MNVWHYIVNIFSNVRADFVEWLQGLNVPGSVIILLESIIGITLILAIVFPVVIIFIWMERRFIARFQLRPGPNRCGPLGLLQPVADAIKVLVKELIVPARGDSKLHFIAPVLVVLSALMAFAVIPIDSGSFGAFADLNIGILFIIAVGSLGTIGIFVGGWGSNNKYSLLGAMRGVAQLISYEVPMVLAIAGVVVIAGSLQMSQIVQQQTVPFILLQPLGFLIFFAGALTELNRSPMDQVEAESELTTGYFTEYSGMKFALFFLGEYISTLAVAAIATTLFLSGWKGPLLPAAAWFLIKVFAVFMVILWLRATFVRLRIDQIMAFSWKFLLPAGIVNLFLTAGEVLIWDTWMSGWQSFPWPFIFVNFAVAAAFIILWSKLFFNLGGGRVEVGEAAVEGLEGVRLEVGEVRARIGQRVGADI
ncbi:MAG: NADH-quinone oxidoreductase subunit NuoH [Dehalococcoidia bacterium]|nr:NADH-quinone oxidoreductase subunit NuoH [Dehalococcoidia bacterium]